MSTIGEFLEKEAQKNGLDSVKRETASSLEQKERSKPLPACQDPPDMTSTTRTITLATHHTLSPSAIRHSRRRFPTG